MQNTKLDNDEFRAAVKKCLDGGEPDQALKLLTATKANSQWIDNACAVCHLRLGNAEKAVQLYRRLIVSGIHFLPDTPAAYKVNFALALLLTNNYDGFSNTLMSVDAKEHVGKTELLAIAKAWRSKFNFIQAIQFWTFGVLPRIPIDIGQNAGYVE